MILLLALRNIMADQRRSILTAALTLISTALLVFYVGLLDGSHRKMLTDSVEAYTGYIQVMGEGYLDTPGYDRLIYDLDAAKAAVADVDGVADSGVRLESFALYSADEAAVGGMFTGIDPIAEPKLSRVPSSVVSGRFLKNATDAEIVLGEGLASRLGVSVGDELAYVSTGLDHSIAADMVTVVGVFRTGLTEFDRSAGFVSKAYMDTVFLSDNAASHIVVLPSSLDDTDAVADAIRGNLSGDITVTTWRDQLSSLVSALEVDSVFSYLSIGIFYLVVFFVIMLASLISIMSRTREIGIIRAIGTRPRSVVGILLTESAIIGGASVIIGGALGAAVTLHFQANPIVIESMEEMYRQFGAADASMPTRFTASGLVWSMAFVFGLNLLSVVHPAVRVTRMTPVDAIQSV